MILTKTYSYSDMEEPRDTAIQELLADMVVLQLGNTKTSRASEEQNILIGHQWQHKRESTGLGTLEPQSETIAVA